MALIDRALRVLGVLHPIVIAAAYVLDRFAITNSVVPELWRPLAIAMTVAGVLTLVLWALLRNWYLAALVASAVFLVLVIHPVPALVLVGLVVWWVGTRFIRRRRGLAAEPAGPSSFVVRAASAYAVVLLAGGIYASWGAFTVGIAEPPTLPEAGDLDDGPNIYVLLLDGYPRADTLSSLFGYDNGRFEAQLAALGFEVAPDARANHNKTWLTNATMLNAQYVAELPEIVNYPRAAPPQTRLSHALINHAAALDVLRESGYRVVSVPTSIVSTDVTSDAEVWSSPHLTGFEIALVTASLPAYAAPGPVLDFLTHDARNLILDQLGAMETYAAEASTEGPQVVLTHLMAPHPPFVLGQEAEYLRGCFPRCKVWETTLEETGMTAAQYAERVRTQVEDLNRRVIETLEAVVADDPSAIVIVLSDHGARLQTEADDEHFRILFAARAPGYDGLFEPDQSPVNVFRRILSRVFDQPLDDLPYRAWDSDWNWALELTERQ